MSSFPAGARVTFNYCATGLAGRILTGTPKYKCEGRLAVDRVADLIRDGKVLETATQAAGMPVTVVTTTMPATALHAATDFDGVSSNMLTSAITKKAEWVFRTPATVDFHSIAVGYEVIGQWDRDYPPVADVDSDAPVGEKYLYVPACDITLRS